MKKLLFILLSAGTILTACEKQFQSITTDQRDLSGKAFIRVVNAAPGTSRNYVYVDNKAVTGAALAYGGFFPSTELQFSVDAGSRAITIKDTLPTTTQTAINFTQNFVAGKYYSVFTYGIAPTVTHLLTEDQFSTITDTTARIRLVNLIASPTANVDIYSSKRRANLFSNIATNTATPFIVYESVPTGGVTDTLFVRATGTTTNLTQLNGLTARRQRFVTVVFRGAYATTTGTNARTLSAFTSY
ncbi:MAG TPA: hypothetical protein DCO78_04660 [Chitinophagaceae bacterium]|nr:hypothetical protein [Chitinophagaceae bacterium]